METASLILEHAAFQVQHLVMQVSFGSENLASNKGAVLTHSASKLRASGSRHHLSTCNLRSRLPTVQVRFFLPRCLLSRSSCTDSHQDLRHLLWRLPIRGLLSAHLPQKCDSRGNCTAAEVTGKSDRAERNCLAAWTSWPT